MILLLRLLVPPAKPKNPKIKLLNREIQVENNLHFVMKTVIKIIKLINKILDTKRNSAKLKNLFIKSLNLIKIKV